MYCNKGVSLQLSAVCALSSPLHVMLLALLCCNLMTALLQDGDIQIGVGHWQCSCRLIFPFTRYCEEMQKGSLYYSKPTTFGYHRSGFVDPNSSNSWLWKTAASPDFLPSLHRGAAAKEQMCACYCFIWPNAVQPYCTEFKSAGQAWPLPILWQVWFIFNYNTHTDCGFWQLALFPDQWEIIVEKQTWGVDVICPREWEAWIVQIIHK